MRFNLILPLARAYLDTILNWGLESPQHPHPGKGALRSAGFPACGFRRLSSRLSLLNNLRFLRTLKRCIPAALACAVIALAGCGQHNETKTEKKSWTIAIIPKGTTHEYWKSIHAGAVKAQEEFAAKGVPVDIIWKGPFREDDRDQQIQV